MLKNLIKYSRTITNPRHGAEDYWIISFWNKYTRCLCVHSVAAIDRFWQAPKWKFFSKYRTKQTKIIFLYNALWQCTRGLMVAIGNYRRNEQAVTLSAWCWHAVDRRYKPLPPSVKDTPTLPYPRQLSTWYFCLITCFLFPRIS